MNTVCIIYVNRLAPDIYTISLHDALPIYLDPVPPRPGLRTRILQALRDPDAAPLVEGHGDGVDEVGLASGSRSEEHTSELQSRPHLVCRLLLVKKNAKRCSIY